MGGMMSKTPATSTTPATNVRIHKEIADDLKVACAEERFGTFSQYVNHVLRQHLLDRDKKKETERREAEAELVLSPGITHLEMVLEPNIPDRKRSDDRLFLQSLPPGSTMIVHGFEICLPAGGKVRNFRIGGSPNLLKDDTQRTGVVIPAGVPHQFTDLKAHPILIYPNTAFIEIEARDLHEETLTQLGQPIIVQTIGVIYPGSGPGLSRSR